MEEKLMIRFIETNIEGCMLIEPEPIFDERGSFVRLACADEFAAHGIPNFQPVQINLSTNHLAGTVRGLHMQTGGIGEGKLVRCAAGTIVDCVVDMRADSPTYGTHALIELSAESLRSLWVPPHAAHGYQTLTPNAAVTYHTTDRYAPERERGFRFNDPAFGIDWPLEASQISVKDATWPLVEDVLWRVET